MAGAEQQPEQQQQIHSAGETWKREASTVCLPADGFTYHNSTNCMLCFVGCRRVSSANDAMSSPLSLLNIFVSEI